MTTVNSPWDLAASSAITSDSYYRLRAPRPAPDHFVGWITYHRSHPGPDRSFACAENAPSAQGSSAATCSAGVIALLHRVPDELARPVPSVS